MTAEQPIKCLSHGNLESPGLLFIEGRFPVGVALTEIRNLRRLSHATSQAALQSSNAFKAVFIFLP